MSDKAKVVEIRVAEEGRRARIQCAPNIVPAPGRYLVAHLPESEDLLPTPLFASVSTSDGFVSASKVPRSWFPGCELAVRGPIGHGFILASLSRRVALVAFNHDPARLLGLAEVALRWKASVALVCADPPPGLDSRVEVHPLRAQEEVCSWSDYAAFDVDREFLQDLVSSLTREGRLMIGGTGQVLVGTPVPCGGLAECGICAVQTKRGRALACSEGPVFDLGLLPVES
jgi:hypothetical protein